MTIWYIARGAGLAALLLLSVTVCIGALTSGRGSAANRVVMQYLHRVTAALGLGALGLHIMAILADSYAHVGWRGALVPFSAGFRPLWVGLGTLAVYTFVLVTIIGFARGRMAATKLGAAVWRGLHALAYAGWGMAMLHGLKSGTDSGVGWVRLLYIACGTAVLGSLAVRVALERSPGLVRTPLISRAEPPYPDGSRMLIKEGVAR